MDRSPPPRAIRTTRRTNSQKTPNAAFMKNPRTAFVSRINMLTSSSLNFWDGSSRILSESRILVLRESCYRVVSLGWPVTGGLFSQRSQSTFEIYHDFWKMDARGIFQRLWEENCLQENGNCNCKIAGQVECSKEIKLQPQNFSQNYQQTKTCMDSRRSGVLSYPLTKLSQLNTPTMPTPEALLPEHLHSWTF